MASEMFPHIWVFEATVNTTIHVVVQKKHFFKITSDSEADTSAL